MTLIDRRSFAALGLVGGATLLGAASDKSSASTGADAPSILAAIAEARRRFADILFNQDHGALPDLFTRDTLLLPAGKPLVRGRDDVVAFWAGASSNPQQRLRSEFDAVDSMIEGDLVIEAGRATVFSVDGGRERLLDRGKYMMVWKHEERRWKRHRDIYNSDAAPA